MGAGASDKTIAFKNMVQATLAENGVKVTRAEAWEIFKSLHRNTIDFVVNVEPDDKGAKRVPLAGVGIYEIQYIKNRKFEEKGGHEKLPRLKFRYSRKIEDVLENLQNEGKL